MLVRVAAVGFLMVLANATSSPVLAAEGRICVNSNCTFRTIQGAFKKARKGDVVTIGAGEYQRGGVLRAPGVTVRGEPGTKIVGGAVRGKAALVIAGRDTVIEDIECSQTRVPDKNGACVRLEKPNLTLRRVHFHNNEMGILTGNRSGLVVIEDSLIENNGYPGSSYGHNIYVGGGELVIRRSRVLSARNEGHEVKSRATRTTIEDSVIANLDSKDSRTIEAPNGGQLIIRNSVIEMGPNSSNNDVIGMGFEHGQHKNSELILEDNIIISDRPNGTRFLHLLHAPPKTIRGNTFVGGSKAPSPDDNTWYPTREAAGLPPYPALPK